MKKVATENKKIREDDLGEQGKRWNADNYNPLPATERRKSLKIVQK